MSITDVPLDFTAIDFETANPSSASACSVGLVKVREGRVVDRAGWFIRPPFGHDFFSMWNTRIHGIVETDVAGAPTWSEQLPDLLAYVEGDPLVAHNAGFDMGVIRGACAASFVDVPSLSYLCSLQVARRTYHLDSYRLPVAAMAAGFEDFPHHDAMADAEACAAIVIHAAKRHDAADLAHLATITGARLASIGSDAAALSRPMAFAEATTAHHPGVIGDRGGIGGSGAMGESSPMGEPGAMGEPSPMGESSPMGGSGAMGDPTPSDAAVADLIRRSGAMGPDDAGRPPTRRAWTA